MVKLTDAEKTHLTDGVNALQNFKNIYGKIYNDGDILHRYNMRELLSIEFDEMFIKAGLLSLTNIRSALISKLTNDYFYKPTEEEKKSKNEIFDALIEVLRTYDKKNDNHMHEYLRYLFRLYPAKEAVSNILTKGFITAMKDYDINSSSELTSALDELFSSEAIDDIDTVYKLVSSNVPKYSNYILICLNPNVSQEDKIKLMKKVYRQKDFPKYKAFLTRNISDIMALDILIEVAIMQNNRIKPERKKITLRDFFKDIFISGDARHSNIYKVANWDKFVNKYKSYFTNPEFMNALFDISVESISRSQWSRESDYHELVRTMHNYLTEDELLEAITKIPSFSYMKKALYSKYLATESDVSKIKLLNAIIGDGGDELNAIIPLFAGEDDRTTSYYNLTKETVQNAIDVLNNYPDIATSYFRNYSFFGVSKHNRNDHAFVKVLNALPVSVLINSKVLDEKYRKTFIMEPNDLETYGKRSYNAGTEISKLFDAIYIMLKERYDNAGDQKESVRKYLKENWFDYFLDNTNTEAVSNGMLKCFNGSDRGLDDLRYVNRWGDKTDPGNIVANKIVNTFDTTIVPLIKNVYDDNLEQQSIILENIDDMLNTVKLILAI